MDEQKIDLLIDYPQRSKRFPIYDIAYKQGLFCDIYLSTTTVRGMAAM